MKYKNKRKNWDSLIELLIENCESFILANDKLRYCVNDFCVRLKTEQIVHANINSSGRVWQSKALITCFCETFDPILESIFPSNSHTYHYLNLNKTPLPLTKTVIKKESCREIADKIKRTVNSLEGLLPSPDSSDWQHKSEAEWDRLMEDGESLELVAGMLYIIFNALDKDDVINWCSICFRRADNKGKFCSVHRPKNDTNYHKGIRIKNATPKTISSKWRRHRSKRAGLGENFLIFSSVLDIPSKTTHEMTGIYLDHQLKELVIDTQTKSWGDVFNRWDQLFTLIPLVGRKFSHLASSYSSWDDYRSALQAALANDYEQTKHPYWVFMMLVEAEDWFSLEEQFGDTRLTNTENEILELISFGLSNMEIASKIGITREYVWRVRKLNFTP